MNALVNAALSIAPLFVRVLDEDRLVLRNGEWRITMLIAGDRFGLVLAATDKGAECSIMHNDEYIVAADQACDRWCLEQFKLACAALHNPSLEAFKKAWKDGEPDW